MTLREEFRIGQDDDIVCALREQIIAHPILEKGWNKCMKTGKMSVQGFTKEEIAHLVHLHFVLADRYEELGCPQSATYWRTGESDSTLPRDAWLERFMREHGQR